MPGNCTASLLAATALMLLQAGQPPIEGSPSSRNVVKHKCRVGVGLELQLADVSDGSSNFSGNCFDDDATVEQVVIRLRALQDYTS